MTIKKSIAKAVDRQQASLIVILIAIWLAFGLESSSFLTQSNILLIALQSAATIISAVGMAYVVSTRGIDLSVGGIALCAAAVAVILSSQATGQDLFVNVSMIAFPIALLTGLFLGLLNAVSITVFRVNPLIATLGSMALFRGLGLHLISASSIQLRGAVVTVVRSTFFGLGVPIIVAVLFSLFAALVVWQTPFGRKMLAIGQSPRSAEESGISTKGILFVAYGLSGLCAAIAGIIMIGRVGQLDATVGLDFEFTVITAVVLGGTSLFGGSNRIFGTFVAAILLSSVDNGLNIIGANPYLYQLIRGLVLLVAVILVLYANRASELKSS